MMNGNPGVGASRHRYHQQRCMLLLPARHEWGEGWREGLVSTARTFFGLPLSLALSPLLRRGERESFVCDGGGIETRPPCIDSIIPAFHYPIFPLRLLSSTLTNSTSGAIMRRLKSNLQPAAANNSGNGREPPSPRALL